MKKIKKISTSVNLDNKVEAIPETIIDSTLNMNMQLVTNVADALLPLDGLNVLQVKKIIGMGAAEKIMLFAGEPSTTFIPLIGNTSMNPITGDLVFDSNHLTTGLSEAVNPTDAINYSQFKNFFSDNYIALSGTTLSNPITGDLFLNNTAVTGIINASENSDAVPLQQLEDTKKSLLPLSGGTMTGAIDMNSFNITNVSQTTNPSNLISLEQAQHTISNIFKECVPLTGTITSKPITGTIFLNNTLVSQIPLATKDSQIISLENLTNVTKPLIPLNNPQLLGNIDLSGYLITNISPGRTDLEGVNLQQSKEDMSFLLPLSGGSMNANLNMGNNIISSVNNTSLDDGDLVNLETLNQYLTTINRNYIPLSGNTSENPITGNLIFDSHHLITEIPNPENNADAINLETLNSTMGTKLTLKDGKLTGPLNMNNRHTLTNIGMSSTPIDSNAATLGYLKNLLSSKQYIPLSGTISGSPISGSLFFNNKATCTQIKDPKNPTDAVNLQTLNTTANQYLSCSGEANMPTLDMNQHQIINVPTPKENADLVNLSYLEQKVSTLVPLSSFTPITMTGPINMSSNTFTNVPEATLDSEIVNYSQVKNTLSHLFNDFIPYSGNNTSPITGDLVLQNTSICNISAPSHPLDAIQYQNLINTTDLYLPLSNGVMKGPINMNKHTIYNVKNPNQSGDLVPLNYLENAINKLLPLAGGTMTGPINMNKHTITNLGNGTEPSDAVNYGQLSARIEKPFYSKRLIPNNISPTNTNFLNFSWKVNTYLDFTLDNPDKTNPQNSYFSSNYEEYFSFSDSKIYILKPGVFLFNLTIQPTISSSSSSSSSSSPIPKAISTSASSSTPQTSNTQYAISIGAFITSPSLGNRVNLTNCLQNFPSSLFLSCILPLNNENIENNNTYLEIQNIQTSSNQQKFTINTMSWDISLLHSIKVEVK